MKDILLSPTRRQFASLVFGVELVTCAILGDHFVVLAIMAYLGVLADAAWAWVRKVDDAAAKRLKVLVPEMEAAIERTGELQKRASERMERAEAVLARDLQTREAMVPLKSPIDPGRGD